MNAPTRSAGRLATIIADDRYFVIGWIGSSTGNARHKQRHGYPGQIESRLCQPPKKLICVGKSVSRKIIQADIRVAAIKIGSIIVARRGMIPRPSVGQGKNAMVANKRPMTALDLTQRHGQTDSGCGNVRALFSPSVVSGAVTADDECIANILRRGGYRSYSQTAVVC